MKPIAFYFILLLSLVFAAITAVETYMYQTLDIAVTQQKEIRAKTQNAQRIDSLARQLVQRLADDSQQDAALAELLKKHDVKVTVAAPAPSTPSTTNESTPVPAGTDKTASPSPNSPPFHS